MQDDAPHEQTEPGEEPTDREVAGDQEDAEVEERRYPSTIGGAVYLGVLLVAGAAIVVAWTSDWRLGVRLLAGSLCGAASVRLVLPARDAGMLAVRNRTTDCVLLAAMGAALFFLAATIPDQSG